MLTGVMKPLPGILSENRNEDICGWKKVFYLVYHDDRHPWPECKIVIAKLIIPKDAAVIFTNHKCRASYAIVDGFYPADRLFEPGPRKKLDTKLAFSAWNTHFYYEDGKTVTPDSFDPDPTVMCSHGIHFFRTYKEAQQYSI